MKVMSTRKFKANFSAISKKKEEVMVTQRGKPLGVFKPVTEEELKEKRISIALRLLSMGKGGKGRVSEQHDKVIYEE